MLKIQTSEEFQKSKRDSVYYQGELGDGYLYYENSYQTWENAYNSYVIAETKYIEKMTPICEFLKNNPNKYFSAKEIQNNCNCIKNGINGAMTSLVRRGIVKSKHAMETNSKGIQIQYVVYSWVDGN